MRSRPVCEFDDEFLGLAILGSHGLEILTFAHDLGIGISLGQHFLAYLVFGDRTATRTTQTVVCFSSTFRLPDFDAPQPAGSYRVDHDEELIESVSRLAWRRVASFILNSAV